MMRLIEHFEIWFKRDPFDQVCCGYISDGGFSIMINLHDTEKVNWINAS